MRTESRFGLTWGSMPGILICLWFLSIAAPASYAGRSGGSGVPWATTAPLSEPTQAVLNQAQLLEGSGDYERAQHLLSDAVNALRPDPSGLRLADLAALQTRRSAFLVRLCRFAEAESSLVPLLGELETRYGKNAEELIQVLNSRGDVRFQLGDYVHAERLYRRAMVLCRRYFDDDDRYAVAPLQGLARVLHKARRFARAGRYADRSYLACRAAANSTPLDRAATADCLGLTRRAVGVYDDAERLFKEALGIVESEYGPNHPAAAVYHNRLAALHMNLRRAEDAEREAKVALEITTRRLGADHLEAASAIFYQALGTMFRDSSANLTAQFDRVLAIRTRCLGTMHPDNAGVYDHRGLYHRMRGEYTEAISDVRTAVAIRRHDYTENSRDMIDHDAVLYSTAYHYAVSDLPAYYFDSGVTDSSLLRELADAILTASGYAFDDMLLRRRCQTGIDDRAGQTEIDRLQHIRAEKAGLFFRDPLCKDSSTRSLTDSLEWIEQDAMSALADRVEDCRSIELGRSLSCDDVSRLLPPGAVFVDYVSYLYVRPSRVYHEEARFAAIVIGQSGLRGMVPLGNIRPDTLIARLNGLIRERMITPGEMTSHFSTSMDSLTRVLYDRLWAPIAALVPESLVLVSYALADYDMSLGSLQDSTGEFLASSHAFHYIDNSRDFLRLASPRMAANDRLFALGDADFDAAPESRRSASVGVADAGFLRPEGYVARNVRSSCQEFGDLLLSPLPGTRTEVLRVAREWRSDANHEATVVTGAAASEEMVKWMAPGHRVIHLATHGYFLPEDCSAPTPRPPGYQDEGTPLRRTGLLLSGANLKGEGADRAGVEDGVLTAEEVSTLPLDGTDLVILSACESGLGFHHSGEGGALGLRRAFQVAGARTVISSIWPVADHVTLELMDRLYGDTTQTYAAILSQYARDKIRQARAAGKFPDPSEWASFVVSGDWRR